MGLLSKIAGIATAGIVGDDPFEFLRSGATQAGKEAKIAGEEHLTEQQALGSEIKGLYQPQIQVGQKAFTGLADYYGGNQQPIIDQAQASPFYDAMVGAGENAVARNRQATGGFRSGTTQENFAQNEQNVLQDLINQQLQGQSNIYNAGAGAQDAYSVAMQNILAGQGATRGEIAGIGINQAANKQNMMMGVVNAGANAASAFSDERLKESIVKIGEKNGLNWYEWDWNKLAKSVGLSGSDEGHVAQEVELVRPDLISIDRGYKKVNYGGF